MSPCSSSHISTFAPAMSSSWTTRSRPLEHAQCSAVLPFSSCRSGSARRSSSSRTVESWPYSAAPISAVLPRSLCWSTSAPRSSSSWTTSSFCGCRHARISAVLPLALRASTSASWSSSIDTSGAWHQPLASISSVPDAYPSSGARASTWPPSRNHFATASSRVSEPSLLCDSVSSTQVGRTRSSGGSLDGMAAMREARLAVQQSGPAGNWPVGGTAAQAAGASRGLRSRPEATGTIAGALPARPPSPS